MRKHEEITQGDVLVNFILQNVKYIVDNITYHLEYLNLKQKVLSYRAAKKVVIGFGTEQKIECLQC